MVDRGAQGVAVPRVEPRQGGIGAGFGQMGEIAHRLPEIGQPAQVPEGDPGHLSSPEKPEDPREGRLVRGVFEERIRVPWM